MVRSGPSLSNMGTSSPLRGRPSLPASWFEVAEQTPVIHMAFSDNSINSDSDYYRAMYPDMVLCSNPGLDDTLVPDDSTDDSDQDVPGNSMALGHCHGHRCKPSQQTPCTEPSGYQAPTLIQVSLGFSRDSEQDLILGHSQGPDFSLDLGGQLTFTSALSSPPSPLQICPSPQSGNRCASSTLPPPNLILSPQWCPQTQQQFSWLTHSWHLVSTARPATRDDVVLLPFLSPVPKPTDLEQYLV